MMYQKVLKHMGYSSQWMAWIPYVNNYALAYVSGFIPIIALIKFAGYKFD